jgi:hypothetical protein
MEAICSSETSVDFQRTTRHYIPEHGVLKLYLYLTDAYIRAGVVQSV